MNSVSASDEILSLIDRLQPRANSLIVTVFGDSITPRGGTIWLGALISLLEPMGLSSRLVRTGVYRLSQEGWFSAEHQGRRSYYTLTDDGRERFTDAESQIYARGEPEWDGTWTLVHFLQGLDQEQRAALRRELGWLGFGQLSRALMAYPAVPSVGFKAALSRVNAQEDMVTFNASVEEFTSSKAMLSSVSDAWDLEALNEEYALFNDNFERFSKEKLEIGTPIDAFCLRTLAIHDYRRILLKSPRLPSVLMPKDWMGGLARERVRQIYQDTREKADGFLVRTVRDGGDALGTPESWYAKRFGGS
ncbi:MAG: PaaX family transcriptional regulator [Hyphomicrobiales bacterium]